jgi:transposase-like protein
MARSKTKTRWTETRRRRWKAAYAEEVIAALKRSGLPTSQFAAQHGLGPERLRRWQRRLEAQPVQRRGRPARSTQCGPLRFAEVGLAGGHVLAAGQFEVVLRGGRVVRVRPSFDAATLRQLVRILEEADGEC